MKSDRTIKAPLPASSRRRHQPTSAERKLARSPQLNALASVVADFRLLNAELPAPQMAVLLEVNRNPGCTATDLQKAWGMVQSSTSRAISALSARHRSGSRGLGLVEQHAANDCRSNRLYLSAEGRRFLSRVEARFVSHASTPEALEESRPRRLLGVKARTAS